MILSMDGGSCWFCFVKLEFNWINDNVIRSVRIRSFGRVRILFIYCIVFRGGGEGVAEILSC